MRHFKRLRTEGTHTYQAMDRPDWLNPRGQVAKSMEMTVRRSIALDRLLSTYTSMQPVRAPVWPTRVPLLDKLCKEATGMDEYWRHPLWSPAHDNAAWRWMYEHWRSGGLRRGQDALYHMLPAENAERVDKLLGG